MDASSQIPAERREYKYLIPRRLMEPIREAARMVGDLDHHAGPDGQYCIRSLYFDDYRYSLFNANEREQSDRYKVRVRSYPEKEGSPAFLEVKRRIQDVIVKSRVSVPMEDWAELVQTLKVDQVEGLSKRGRQAAERFLSLVHIHHLRPVLLVDYQREAWISRVDDYARLTFDHHITSQVHETLDLVADPRRWRSSDHRIQTSTAEPMVVLELKFANAAPAWMVSMVRRMGLTRHSFSKYCYGIVNQHQAPMEMRTPAYQTPPARTESATTSWAYDRSLKLAGRGL